ncbi:MAG: subtilisin, partial [Rhodothermaceae bacterium]|nr:subtilisin [Rhodothermaceae bacterium]
MRFCFLLALVGLLLPLTATAQQARVQAALHYLDQHATTLGLAEEDVDEVMVTDAYTSRRSGLTHVYVRQAIGGIEVVGTEMTINVDANDRVIHRAGTFRTDLLSEARVRQPALNAQQAVQRAATHVGLSAPSALRVMESNNDPSQAVALAALEADNPIRARLVYAPDQNDALHLAWEVELAQRSQKDYWLVYVDAATGAEVRRVSLTVSESFGEAAHAHDAAVPSFAPIQERTAPAAAALVGSYKVFEAPVEAPIYASPASPADGRTTAVNPDDATASPFGWHDTNGSAGAEFTTTQGNNVHAYTDTDANNSPDAGSAPDGGAGLSFDFPVDFTAAPSTYRPAAVTNLFYWNNIIHDVLYQYGFDEAGGNFQTNTYGNGGSGNDHVLAEAQDGSGTNNANFSTPSDGSAPRMQMFIGTNPSPDVDGDFDNAVIVHEYGHGVSNRLTGGPNNVGCLSNSEQMGEGWSDYYGMMFTMDANDTPTQARGIGNYLFGQSTNGGGIRPAPYSTSFGTNGFTYQDTRTQIAPHGVGFVWATILWEVTWDMIDAHGFDADLYNAGGTAGNQIMLNLVT